MLRNTLQNFVLSPYASTKIVLLAVALVLPSLWGGLFADDFSHFTLLNFDTGLLQPDKPALFHLFSFVDPDPARRQQLLSQSLIPWWTVPEFSMVFFRPLAELSHYIDYRLLTNWPALMHLHSLLWYIALLLVLNKVYGELIDDQKVKIAALLFFAVDATHGFTLAWLANRGAIMATVFSLGALWFFIQYDKHLNLKYLLLSTSAVALAFTCGEIGITSGVLLGGYMLICSRQRLSVKAYALIPALMVFVVWVVFYSQHGYGALGNKAYYADMLSEPIFYAHNFIDRFPIAMSMLFNIVPLHFSPDLHSVTIASGLLVFILLLVYCVKRNSNLLWFSFLVIILSIVPVSSAEMQERNLLFASCFSSVILADLLFYCYSYSEKMAAKFLSVIIVAFHLFFSAVLMLPMSYAPEILATNVVQKVEGFIYKDKPVISLGLPLFEASFFTPVSWYINREKREQFVNLTTAKHFSLEKISSKKYVLVSDEGVFSGVDSLLRDVDINPIYQGDKFQLPQMYITVQALNDDGFPSAILVETTGDFTWIFWEGNDANEITLESGEKYIK